MFADLPVQIEHPVRRLRSITEQMADLKRSEEAVAGEVLTSLGGFALPMLLALGERVATHVPQHSVNTVTTNVPGPQHPLYAVGRRMLEAFPYVPLGARTRRRRDLLLRRRAHVRRDRRLRQGARHRRSV